MGLGAYFTKGFQYYIDFAGGSEIRITFQNPVETGDLRKALADAGHKGAVIQKMGRTDRSFIIQAQGTSENVGEKIYSDLKTKYTDNPVVLDGIDWVGPEVGKDLTYNAIVAVLLSLLLILLYITVRSTFRFAVGAVVALAHDALVVLAVFLILGEQISLNVLAAILTILGYSLNDTIVIFSRIRQNMKEMKGKPEAEIVDISINQTLRRTLLTSTATLLAVLSLFFLGGESLYGLSLVMLVGIIAGTYSSVYIASPVMLALKPSEREKAQSSV